MAYKLKYTSPFGNEEKIGNTLVVEKTKTYMDWKKEELNRMSLAQIKEIAEKKGVEKIEELSLDDLKNWLVKNV